MNNTLLRQFDTDKEKKLPNPKAGIVPVGVSEKLVRDEVNKLTENAEEIKKLKEQIKKNIKDKNISKDDVNAYEAVVAYEAVWSCVRTVSPMEDVGIPKIT